jgi:hypothetical protein
LERFYPAVCSSLQSDAVRCQTDGTMAGVREPPPSQTPAF